ncbi:MAG TPA: hypothetical protein VHY81_01150 [Acidimicrobiales bacterium]|jgi:hypothetical protein|nr:hypothetical protein [Acidimicrobiales bacterium]
MSRWLGYRWSAHAPALGAAVVCAIASGVLVAGPSSAGASSLAVKVSPDRGLVNGQVVTVSGRGLSHSSGGSGLTWFVTECTAAVRGRVNLSTDTPHCDVTDARGIKVASDGSFSTKFRVRAGIVGDGYCGTSGHMSCVIGVSTAKGQGTVVKIGFATPKTTTSTTSTTAP